MNEPNKYIAITFGPITRVISYAKSTKELWAASYFFTYLAKQVMTPFRGRTFLLPQLADEMYDNTKTRGAGLFPDRYIFRAQEGDFDTLCVNCDQLYINLGKAIGNTINKPHKANDITTYLKNTIKIYCFEKEFLESSNIVHECEDQLAVMELEDVFPQKEPCNYLSLFFEKVNGSFLTNDAFEKNKVRIFETIIEYAAVELNSKEYWDRYNLNGNEIQQIRNTALPNKDVIPYLEENKLIKPYHKYIAIVKADGDNVTKTIKGLKDEGKVVAEFDACLLKYNLRVIRLIEAYRGKAIFLGGDDLLFFAPVRNKKNNIFTLIKKINSAFNQEMKDLPNPPTLSFGISISYYKHPMFEAIEMADEQLMKAKSGDKNQIAWHLRKHSGQISQSLIKKCKTTVYEQFIDLIKKGMVDKNHPENVYSSYTYWLIENKEMLAYILRPAESSETNRKVVTEALANYLKNTFNEPLHQKMDAYMNTLIQYLIVATSEISAEYAIDSLPAILRFVGFLKSEIS